MALERISLKNWYFNSGNEISCPEQAAKVSIPHTWNVEEGTEDYWGRAGMLIRLFRRTTGGIRECEFYSMLFIMMRVSC